MTSQSSMDIQGKRFLVVGMARSGLAAALFLRRRGGRVVVSEMRPGGELRNEIPKLLEAGVAVETGGHRERTFLDTDCIIVSPGVPSDLPLLQRARAQKIPVLAEIELASRFLKGVMVAITGANGKTTTTALAGEIATACGFQVQVGGNIGTPLISLVDTSTDQAVNVIEVSSFQLETIETFHPQISVVLNLSPDHLDRHGSMEAYAAAKERIFLNQTPKDYAVLNADDSWCRQYATRVRSQIRWFSRTQPVKGDGIQLSGDKVVWKTGGRERTVLTLSDIPLRGAHNVENVMAASAVGCILADPEYLRSMGFQQRENAFAAIRDAVRSFKAVEHRLEFVARINNVDYFNDSKATNVDATIKALEAFRAGLWVILGGKDKGSDYSVLAPLLKERARGILLIGAAAEKIAGQLQPLGLSFMRAGTLEHALEMASAHAQPGDTVLLAPACASFDQFQNYEHRGRVFKELVARMTQGRNGGAPI
jgi:UDP-N-acetylmuramoylalanine--D-glutamate ligase